MSCDPVSRECVFGVSGVRRAAIARSAERCLRRLRPLCLRVRQQSDPCVKTLDVGGKKPHV